jgi:tripartite-type tricarboxylate transporter receptor subunit TctC
MSAFRTTSFAAFAAAAAMLSTAPALAQDWPNKPVKVVVPFAAGGATDRLGRLVSDHLSKVFRQQFYVENRVGGGGALGSGQVARVEPDGYTLLIGGYGQHVLGPAANPNIGYDPVGDFTHIAMIGGESFALSAHASVGVKSFKELVALSQASTQPLNVGSPGTGTLGEWVVEVFRRRRVFNINHIPYRGGGPLLTDFIGHHVPVAMTTVFPILPHVAAGTLTPLAVTSTERIPSLKDVPTFTELGHAEASGAIWFWMAGPKNLPMPIVDKLSEEIRRFIKTPEVRQHFEQGALLAMDADVPRLNAFVAEELRRWTAFAEETGLRQK